ncbi:TPA: leukocidin family pore-forming toxin, partial [Staphylococcus aureus]
QREMDRYTNFWNQLHWIGNNYKDENRATHTSIYEVDWENHTVKLIDTQSKEKNPMS